MNTTLPLSDKSSRSFIVKRAALTVLHLLLNFFNYFFHFVLPYSVEWNFIFTFAFAGLINFTPIKLTTNIKLLAVGIYFVIVYIILFASGSDFHAFKLFHICLGLFLVGKDKSIYQNIGVTTAVILLNFLFIADKVASL